MAQPHMARIVLLHRRICIDISSCVCLAEFDLVTMMKQNFIDPPLFNDGEYEHFLLTKFNEISNKEEVNKSSDVYTNYDCTHVEIDVSPDKL